MADNNFEEFPKIARWSREVVITEKIDGTNAAIVIEGENIFAQSRNRIITPEDDNFGFATWVAANKDSLITALGDGRHFGEWFGSGIQRRYNMNCKMFALFNTTRWAGAVMPDGVTTVPELYRGMLEDSVVDRIMNELKQYGSIIAPGFMNPEGIIIYHTAARVMFKKTFDKDQEGKGQ